MAFNLNGSSQFFTAPLNSSLQLDTGDMTISAKMYFASFSTGSKYASISLGTGANGNSSNGSNFVSCGWCLYAYNNQQIDFIRNDTTGTVSIMSKPVTLNTGIWRDITISRSGNTFTMYLDGSQIGATATNTTTLNSISSGGSQDLHVGRLYTGNATETSVPGTAYFQSFMNGRIAELAIWKGYCLNAAEILSIAKGFSASFIHPQNLSFYSPLIQDLNDIRGGLGITNNNSATSATHPRVYT